MGTPLIIGNRTAFISSTAGTVTYAVGSALDGYQSPEDAGIADGSRVPYVALDSASAPTKVEIGEGIISSGSPWTLSRLVIRRTIIDGVAGSSAINWPSGSRVVAIMPNAANLVLYDDDGLLRQNGRGVPAIPTGSSGAGQFVAIEGAADAAVSLPSGGTWAYWVASVINASAIWSAFRAAGVAAGGTQIGSAVTGNSWVGFAWRVA